MAVRYVCRSPFATRVGGVRFVFNPDRIGPDGTLGYSPDEVKTLPKDLVKASFNKVEVAGASIVEEVVERATAAPGEKRASKPKSSS